MRGNHFVRQLRIIRASEASINGLSFAEISRRKESGARTIYQDLEAFQTAGFPFYTEQVDKTYRRAFVGTFKFKIPASFTLTHILSLKSRVKGPFSAFSSRISGSMNGDPGFPTSQGGSIGRNEKALRADKLDKGAGANQWPI
jgi:hypothetical protein